jgi:hypothetical protein
MYMPVVTRSQSALQARAAALAAAPLSSKISSAIKNHRNIVRVYNAVTAVLVAYQYFYPSEKENPSKLEYGFDVLVHSAHALLPNSASKYAKEWVSTLDCLRIGRIYGGIFIGSSIPTVANLTDLANHYVNLESLDVFHRS